MLASWGLGCGEVKAMRGSLRVGYIQDVFRIEDNVRYGVERVSGVALCIGW